MAGSEAESMMTTLSSPSAPQRMLLQLCAASLVLSLLLKFGAGLGAAGGVAMLCFASIGPGLLFLALACPSSMDGMRQTSVLCLALSPFFMATTTLLLVLTTGIPLGWAAHTMIGLVSAGLLVVWFLSRRESPVAETDARASRDRDPWFDWIGLLPPFAMAMVAAAVFVPLGNRLSYHGLFHAGFVAQIAAGMIPPENPAMAGEPLEFYWLYHWLLALYGELGGASMFATAPWIQVISLFVYVGASYGLARRFFGARLAALAALCLGFVGNLLLPIIFVSKALLSGLPEMPTVWPMDVIHVGWLGGDPRVVTLLAKFFNIGGFGIGLALWSVLLDEMVPAAGRRARRSIVFIGLCSIVFFHTSTALAVFPALAVGFFSLGLKRGTLRSPLLLWRANAPMALVFLAALVFVSPYLIAVTSGSHGGAPFSVPRTAIIIYNAKGILLGATPLLPIVMLCIPCLRSDPRARFLLATSIVLLLVATFLELPDSNQYKIIQIAFLPAGGLFFWLMRERGIGQTTVRLPWMFAATLVLTLASHTITSASYFMASSTTRDRFRGDGGYLANPGDPAYYEALQWLRRHSPPDAVVITKPTPFGMSRIRAVTGRGVYVLIGGHHTEGNLRYLLRLALVERLFSPVEPLEPTLERIAASLDRPLYLLVLRNHFPDSLPALIRRFDSLPRRLPSVFRGDGIAIYQLAGSGRAQTAQSPAVGP